MSRRQFPKDFYGYVFVFFSLSLASFAEQQHASQTPSSEQSDPSGGTLEPGSQSNQGEGKGKGKKKEDKRGLNELIDEVTKKRQVMRRALWRVLKYKRSSHKYYKGADDIADEAEKYNGNDYWEKIDKILQHPGVGIKDPEKRKRIIQDAKSLVS